MQECARSCGDFDDCNYYTFEEKYGHCVMFEDCDSYDKSCETCKSGERKCLVQLGKDSVIENRSNFDINCLGIFVYIP